MDDFRDRKLLTVMRASCKPVFMTTASGACRAPPSALPGVLPAIEL
jgi:hypothetical protein